MTKQHIEYKGFDIYIEQDIEPQNPRTEWDNLCTIVCWHPRYNLGDTHSLGNSDDLYEFLADLDPDDFETYEQWQNLVSKKIAAMIDTHELFIKPVYLYDHSGLSVSTSTYTCPWDSGQVGFIYVTKETLDKEGPHHYTPEQVSDILDGEVETYNQYLTGAVYGYTVTHSDYGDLDLCWGFFGYDHEKSGLLAAAQASIDYEIKRIAKEEAEDRAAYQAKKHSKIKGWIKHRVPYQYRIYPA